MKSDISCRRALGVFASLIAGAVAAAPPDMAVSFGFEPRVGTFAGLDERLRAYGFAPVASPVMPTWGLRGRAFFAGGFFGALTMTAGVRVTPGPAIPTTLSLTETTAGVGYHTSWGLFVSLEAGFSALTQSVSSTREGGALVYLGPVVAPRVGWLRQFFEPFGWFIAASIGGNVHVPIGRAHTNPLWEEPFTRSTITSFTLTIESGLGYRSLR